MKIPQTQNIFPIIKKPENTGDDVYEKGSGTSGILFFTFAKYITFHAITGHKINRDTIIILPKEHQNFPENELE